MLERQIISERSLIAIQELISFLKQNVRRRDVFHAVGHDVRVQQIANELDRGGGGLRNMLEQGWVIESAAALQFFLRRLKKPLIPTHIQALALDENPGVLPEIVAQDILGLLVQDLSGRHAILVMTILDLLHCILKYSPSDELTGCNIPITMLTIFFNMQFDNNEHQAVIEDRLLVLEANMALRRYLLTSGHRGDVQDFELFRPHRRQRLRPRRSFFY